jgi:formate hydrogenlyase transcriptional activator
MIGYVTLGTNDLERAARYYDALLGEIGARRVMDFGTFIAWGNDPQGADAYDEKVATVGTGVMVALMADSKEKVDPSGDPACPRSRCRRRHRCRGRRHSRRPRRRGSAPSLIPASGVPDLPGEHRRSAMGPALVSNLEPRALFGAIATCLRRVVSHDYTSLAVYSAERRAFDLWAIEFAGKGLIREHMTVPLEGSPAGVAFAAGTAVRLARADLEGLSAEVAGLLLAEGVQSMCCVPLTVHDRRLGTLSIGRLGGEPFTDDEEGLVVAVAKQVAFSVQNALAFQEIASLKDRLAAEKVYLEEEIRTNYDFEEIVGQSPALKRALHQVETVAPTDSTVLILGETGTGKELIARAIHHLSGRRARTLVKVNCAAIPTGLLENELFGHERGAFTGAIAQRIGRFELANGGTLFLDEVGDIPTDLQPKLLRVLQEQEFERVGGTRTLRVDVRVVAATNSDLEERVAAGTFRSDLYYRLNVFPIALPPLRERPEDIPDLVRTCVRRFARRLNKRIERIPADTMAAICRYDWPGNVRELENAIERAVILTTGPVLQVPVSDFRPREVSPPNDPTLEATEREAILRTLRETNGVLGGPRGAAERLGLKRTSA